MAVGTFAAGCSGWADEAWSYEDPGVMGLRSLRGVAEDEITTRMPSTNEARRLNIGPGTPVAQLLCTAYDQDDRPVRLAATILPGDRYVLIYDVDGN